MFSSVVQVAPQVNSRVHGAHADMSASKMQDCAAQMTTWLLEERYILVLYFESVLCIFLWDDSHTCQYYLPDSKFFLPNFKTYKYILLIQINKFFMSQF